MGTVRGKKKGSARDSNRLVRTPNAKKKSKKKIVRRADGPPKKRPEPKPRPGTVKLKIKELKAITKRCPIIGITGPAGCGKGTVADYLSAYYGYRGTSFATPLKKAAAIVFNMSEQDMFTEVREKKEQPLEVWGGLSIRRMLQLLGTEVARSIYENVWVNNMDLRTKGARDIGMGIVIDDMRFDNEAQWVRDNGGRVIHLSRPSEKDGTKHTEHASEIGVEKKGDDIVLINCGTIDALKSTLDEIMIEQRLCWKLELSLGNRGEPNTEKQDLHPTPSPEYVAPPVYSTTTSRS